MIPHIAETWQDNNLHIECIYLSKVVQVFRNGVQSLWFPEVDKAAHNLHRKAAAPWWRVHAAFLFWKKLNVNQTYKSRFNPLIWSKCPHTEKVPLVLTHTVLYMRFMMYDPRILWIPAYIYSSFSVPDQCFEASGSKLNVHALTSQFNNQKL